MSDAKVIVRQSVPGLPNLKPGTVVGCFISDAFSGFCLAKSPQWLCFLLDNTGERFWIARENLLSIHSFLTRCPASRFWGLAKVREFHSSEKLDCFLSVPRTISFGDRPYRFESEGELRYYVQAYDLRLSDFLVIKFDRHFQ